MIFQLRANRYTYIAYVSLVLLLGLVTFGSLYEHQFWDGWDDWDIMADTAAMAEDVSYLFSSDKITPVRPPRDLVVLLGYLLWEDNLAGYHMLQVGLHLAASLLLAYTFRRLGIDLELSLISAFLFLVNVAHFRAVHWIVCISYILALIFGLIVLICYRRFLNTGRKRWMIAATSALAISVFSHPSAVSIVLFCIYLTWRINGSVLRTVFLAWPLLVSALVFGALTDLASPNSLQSEGILTSLEIVRLPKNLLWYMGRLVTSAHWLTSATASNQQNLWEMGVGLLACIGIFILYRRRIFPAADWAIWSLLTVLPFINNPLDRLAFGPSRQLYFASAGSSLILAWGIRSIVDRQKTWVNLSFRRIIFSVLLILLTVSSFLSLRSAEALSIYLAGRGYAFRSNFKMATQLFERAHAHAPRLVPSDIYFRLSTAGFSSGKSYEHILEEALVRDPPSPLIHMLLGVSAFLQKDPEVRRQGEERIRKAFEIAGDTEWLRWNTALAYQNLATYYHQSKRYQEAVNLYARALKMRPNYPAALFNLGNALYAQGKIPEAIQTMQQAVQINPTNLRFLRHLSTMFTEQNRFEEAVEVYRRALRIDPDNADLHLKSGILYTSEGRYVESALSFERAVALSPERVETHLKLAQAYEKSGRIEEAVREYRRALSLNPDNPEARHNLNTLREDR